MRGKRDLVFPSKLPSDTGNNQDDVEQLTFLLPLGFMVLNMIK